MQFLCQQTGHDLGELVVHATLADTQNRFRALSLARDARVAFDSDGLVAAGAHRDGPHPHRRAGIGLAAPASRRPAKRPGVGIDLVEVEPLRQLRRVGGRSFVDAAWTAPESSETPTANRKALAGKWAAKEAVMKALQHGIGDIDPRDVEIVASRLAHLEVELHRAARAIAKQDRNHNLARLGDPRRRMGGSDRHRVVAAESQARRNVRRQPRTRGGALADQKRPKTPSERATITTTGGDDR